MFDVSAQIPEQRSDSECAVQYLRKSYDYCHFTSGFKFNLRTGRKGLALPSRPLCQSILTNCM